MDEHDDIQQLRSEGDLNISANRKAWGDTHIGTGTRDVLERDEQYFLHQSLSTPCLNAIVGCEGSYLIDAEGRRILDFHGNNVHQVGFSNPRVVEAIKRQLDELSFCTRRYTCEPAVTLANKLSTLAPGDLSRILFAPSGTAAIGMALKLARASTGKHKTISMWESFHGASLDAISIGGEAMFRKGMGPLLPGTEHVPPPDPGHCPWDCGRECSLKCADYIEYVLEREGGDVAAVIAETIRCTPFIPPPDYWKRVRAACDKWGALLILDEIPLALGRTGKMFVCEHYDVVPDMLVIGKGLGGGIMPLAALIAREHLNEPMRHRALGHYTHEKSPVACAAGLATIEEIEERGLLRNAETLGLEMVTRLLELKRQFKFISDVRGLGLVVGVEIRIPGQSAGENSDLAERIMYESLTLGLNFKLTMGNILTLTPPLTLKNAEMDSAIEILKTVFDLVQA